MRFVGSIPVLVGCAGAPGLVPHAVTEGPSPTEEVATEALGARSI